MPRGARPKTYPAEQVARVRELYAAGQTQAEIALRIGVSQKVVWNLMRRHGLGARVAAKRDQRGPKNSTWRGDRAGYAAFHLRVTAARGQPQLCEECGTTEARRFEWANLTGHYEDVSDYRRLCCSCHKRFDGIARNLGAHSERKAIPETC